MHLCRDNCAEIQQSNTYSTYGEAPHEGGVTDHSAKKPSIYSTHHGTGTAWHTHKESEKKVFNRPGA